MQLVIGNSILRLGMTETQTATVGATDVMMAVLIALLQSERRNGQSARNDPNTSTVALARGVQ